LFSAGGWSASRVLLCVRVRRPTHTHRILRAFVKLNLVGCLLGQ